MKKPKGNPRNKNAPMPSKAKGPARTRLVAVETPLDEIKPYPNNPRVNDGAVRYVAASIRAFGWRRPILVDEDGVILAGHTRLKAARQLGLATAPVCVVRGLSDAQKAAFRIRDNRAGELSLFDWDRVFQEIAGLSIDMSQFGFDAPAGEEAGDGADASAGTDGRVICPRCGKAVE